MQTTNELHQVRCPTCNARLFDTRERWEYVPYEDEADIVLRCWRRGQCGGRAMLYLRRVEEKAE